MMKNREAEGMAGPCGSLGEEKSRSGRVSAQSSDREKEGQE